MGIKINEKEVKRGINNYLKSLGEGYFFHYSAFGGVPGVADKIGIFRGQFVAIEAKAPYRRGHKDGGLSPTQLTFGENVRKNGGHYIIAYHRDDVAVYFKDNFTGLPSR